jgi:hypothetical protein
MNEKIWAEKTRFSPKHRYTFDESKGPVTIVTTVGGHQQLLATGHEFEIPSGHHVTARFADGHFREILAFAADGRIPESAGKAPRVVDVQPVEYQEPGAVEEAAAEARAAAPTRSEATKADTKDRPEEAPKADDGPKPAGAAQGVVPAHGGAGAPAGKDEARPAPSASSAPHGNPPKPAAPPPAQPNRAPGSKDAATKPGETRPGEKSTG